MEVASSEPNLSHQSTCHSKYIQSDIQHPYVLYRKFMGLIPPANSGLSAWKTIPQHYFNQKNYGKIIVNKIRCESAIQVITILSDIVIAHLERGGLYFFMYRKDYSIDSRKDSSQYFLYGWKSKILGKIWGWGFYSLRHIFLRLAEIKTPPPWGFSRRTPLLITFKF